MKTNLNTTIEANEIAEQLKKLPDNKRERALGFIFGLQAQSGPENTENTKKGGMKEAS